MDSEGFKSTLRFSWSLPISRSLGYIGLVEPNNEINRCSKSGMGLYPWYEVVPLTSCVSPRVFVFVCFHLFVLFFPEPPPKSVRLINTSHHLLIIVYYCTRLYICRLYD
jgi:hypothetical protein